MRLANRNMEHLETVAEAYVLAHEVGPPSFRIRYLGTSSQIKAQEITNKHFSYKKLKRRMRTSEFHRLLS